jgi:hypothetical protein
MELGRKLFTPCHIDLGIMSSAPQLATKKADPTGPAIRLPIDILYHIFVDYAENETPDAPIETLLLVCRLWHDIALEHKRLWTNFRVVLKNGTSATSNRSPFGNSEAKQIRASNLVLAEGRYSGRKP